MNDDQYLPGEQVLAIIKNLVDVPVRPFMTIDFGREKKRAAVSFIVEYSMGINPYLLTSTIRDQLPSGYFAFQGTDKWVGKERHHGVEIVIARASSQFEAINLAEASGVIRTYQAVR